MDIPIHAKVNCSDGPAGQTTHVVLKPTSEKVTHIVVDDGGYPGAARLVPIDHITQATSSAIQLDCTREALGKMPPFELVHFIPSNLNGYIGSGYVMWPYFEPISPYITLTKEHIPANELAIRRGANVEATDGRVGRVDEFIIDAHSDHITHLVLREGHLWGQKDVAIPVKLIDHYKDNAVYLKADKNAIEALPEVPVKRKGK
jgi:uncharacterized protein YrrD